jgi:hypothetical protein
MEFPHFIRVERAEADGVTRHYVLHAQDPKLLMEITPDVRGTGTIRRVCVPNSWTGNYSRYAKVIAKAEAFLRAAAGAGEAGGSSGRYQG